VETIIDFLSSTYFFLVSFSMKKLILVLFLTVMKS